jgi:hypothetical protein
MFRNAAPFTAVVFIIPRRLPIAGAPSTRIDLGELP